MRTTRLIVILLSGFTISCGQPELGEAVAPSGKADGPRTKVCEDLDYYLAACMTEDPYGECIDAPAFDFAEHVACCQSYSATMPTCSNLDEHCKADGIDDVTKTGCCKAGAYDYCVPEPPEPTTACVELDYWLAACTSEDPYGECIDTPALDFDEHVGCCQSFAASLTSCSVLDQHCQVEGIDDATKTGCCKVGTYAYCQL